MTDTLEQRARGLLASEFPLADGFSAVLVRDMSIPQLGVVDTAIALRAIVAALQAQQPPANMGDFCELLGTYWGLAYAEGREGRVHDTENGDAQRVLSELRDMYAKAQQPGAQAVAWHTDDNLTDKSATTYDPAIAERWRAKGWPVTPHYLGQPPSIPEPSDADVELAWSTLRSTTQPRDSCACDGDMRAALTTYTARLRERIGQAPWGDGDA